MPLPGNLLTTAMAVMPHTDAQKALDAAVSLDIPFWPQLPNLSYYEDMYVQASEHFPGIVLDLKARTLGFSMEKFMNELEETLAHFEEPDYFDISPSYSVVYHAFLKMDLASRPAIRGQLEGPISFGLNVKDERDRPILFDDTVRPFMLDFMARRVNVQLARLKAINENAFMYVDEPGLQFIFSALSGFGDAAAGRDLTYFFEQIDRPRGIHLCGNPDWDFLLNLDLDILSLDVYSNGEVFSGYGRSVKRFLDRGGVLVWGIVPTTQAVFEAEGLEALEARLLSVWEAFFQRGVDRERLIKQSLLSPATCCLINADREKTVEKAFETVRALSARLRERFGL